MMQRFERVIILLLEIGAGLGALAGKAWRIGLMGVVRNKKNVLLCLSALDNMLSVQDAHINSGVAVDAALANYSLAATSC